jgi:hypothetical protein
VQVFLLMQYQIEQLFPSDNDWQHLCKKLQVGITLTALVLTAWQMGLWFARAIVEQQLRQRAQSPTFWENCPKCNKRLRSKGFIKRQMLTLVGQVEWQRRVGRCSNRCAGSQSIPFDNVLNIHPYQQTSSCACSLDVLQFYAPSYRIGIVTFVITWT